MFDLVNIFDVFLPQLLHDPNPKDPLNGEAASLLLKDPEKYKSRVKEYVKKFASGKRYTFEPIKYNKGTNENLVNLLDNLNNKEGINDGNSIISELSNASDMNSDNEVKN